MWRQAYALEGHMWMIFSCRHLKIFFLIIFPLVLVLKAQTAFLDIKWVTLLSWILLVSHPGVWVLTEENISQQTTHYCWISLIRPFLRDRPWISDFGERHDFELLWTMSHWPQTLALPYCFYLFFMWLPRKPSESILFCGITFRKLITEQRGKK